MEMTSEQVRDLVAALLTGGAPPDAPTATVSTKVGANSLVVRFSDGTEATITTTVLRARP